MMPSYDRNPNIAAIAATLMLDDAAILPPEKPRHSSDS
jgi:hypothetical protein